MTHRIGHVKASLSATSPLHIPCRFACVFYSGVAESRCRLQASALNRDEAAICFFFLPRCLTKLWAAEIFLGRGVWFHENKRVCMCIALLGKGSTCAPQNICAANCAGIASPKMCVCCVSTPTICYIHRGLRLTMLGRGFSATIGGPQTIFTPSSCVQSPFENTKDKLFPFLVPMVPRKCGPSLRLE